MRRTRRGARGSGRQVQALRAGEGRAVQVRAGQVRVGQVRVGQVRAGQVRAGQVRGGQVRAGEVRAGQVRVGQVRTDQLRACQVGAAEVGVFKVDDRLVVVGRCAAAEHGECRLDVGGRVRFAGGAWGWAGLWVVGLGVVADEGG